MANSYGQFTGWGSVPDILKSEPSCTSHKPRASFQRWQVGGDLVHGKCPHAATQSYIVYPDICNVIISKLSFYFSKSYCENVRSPPSDSAILWGFSFDLWKMPVEDKEWTLLSRFFVNLGFSRLRFLTWSV